MFFQEILHFPIFSKKLVQKVTNRRQNSKGKIQTIVYQVVLIFMQFFMITCDFLTDKTIRNRNN